MNWNDRNNPIDPSDDSSDVPGSADEANDAARFDAADDGAEYDDAYDAEYDDAYTGDYDDAYIEADESDDDPAAGDYTRRNAVYQDALPDAEYDTRATGQSLSEATPTAARYTLDTATTEPDPTRIPVLPTGDEAAAVPLPARRGKARERRSRRRQGLAGKLAQLLNRGPRGGTTADAPAPPPTGTPGAGIPARSTRRAVYAPTSTAPAVTPVRLPAPPPPDPLRDAEREARRQRRQGAAPAGATGTFAAVSPRAVPNRVRPPQVAAPGPRRFELSDLPLASLRLLAYAIGAAVLFFGVILALGFFKDDAPTVPPNALWVGVEWTFEERTPAEYQAFAERLKTHQIGTIYAWVSWLKPDTTWAGIRSGTNEFSEVEGNVRAFVTAMRAAYPELRMFGWIGFPTEAEGIPYRLNDTAAQDELARFSKRVLDDLGFDGVFLNVEPVWNANSLDFIQLLNRVRVEIGSAPISVAIPPDWTPDGVNIPKPPLIVPGTAWDEKFKQRVALLTDELAIMAYNSGLSSPFDYIPWMAYQVEAYAKAVSAIDGGADIVIGIPTYDNEPPGHLTDVENVSSALTGVRQGLLQAGDAASYVRGIAIYMDTFTDETEWLQFRQGWIER